MLCVILLNAHVNICEKGNMSTTLKDIAKIVKVSHTAVSRALNNSPLIKVNIILSKKEAL